MPTCINEVNPRGGLCFEHTEFCAYPHRDGELDIRVTAVSHAHFNISKDRPNGTSCANVCAWHSEYFIDRDGKKRKQESAIFISGDPIIDPRTKPGSSTAQQVWNPETAAAVEDSSPSTIKETAMKSKTSKGTAKTKVAKGKAKTNGKVVDLTDADVALLASYQDKKIGGVITIERMTANAMVSIYRRIKAASKAKPIVHADLNAYDKRLARELVRLGIVAKDTIEGTGLSYFAKAAK